MCGIAGIVAYDRPPEVEAAGAMAARLDHRGPDASGSYAADGVAIESRRLAILDPSDAGRQPFASDDGRLQLVHNGEIYNYRELRRELVDRGHGFRSGTDTEVILAAYREWGERCVERFNGMWAFALWDENAQRLFCSRDRFGVKPFYYRHAAGRFAFASELKAFVAAGEPLAANERLVRDYLEHGLLDHTDETFFDGIVALPPAHSAVLDCDGLHLTRYWQLELRDPPEHPAEALRELFVDAVRLRLRSDVPVGTCLSGGIDSSAIACAIDHLMRTEPAEAAPLAGRQKTVTAYFEDEGYDERAYAQAIVEHAGTEAHWVTIGDDELVAALPRVIEAQDEPFGSTSIVAQWFVMRTAREAGLKVMLDGQGGDELFAGYPASIGFRFADLLAQRRLRELAGELAAYRRLSGAGVARTAAALARPFLPIPLEQRLRSRLTGARSLVHAELAHVPSASDSNDGRPFPDRLRGHLRTLVSRQGLPALLHSEDRNSMAHSIEARVPFLDYRLVELAFSLRATELIEGGRTKAVLRRALADLLPPLVRERADKLGFVTPEERWLRGPLGALAEDVFASLRFAERGWVDAQAARRRLARHRRGERAAGFELWRALNLELWACTFLDR